MMMMLGQFQFSLNTAAYQSTSRDSQWRWAQQELIGCAPAVQYIGPGEEQIEIEGVIYPHYRGGTGQVDLIRAQAKSGQLQLLVAGSGAVLGKWAIISLNERQTIFADNGVPRKSEFTLRLLKGADSNIGPLAELIIGATNLVGNALVRRFG